MQVIFLGRENVDR